MSGAVRAVGNNTTVIGMVVLKPRGEDRVRGGHPWVYRSDIAEVTGDPGAVARAEEIVAQHRAANAELMAENSAKSPAFKKIFDHMRAFQRDQQAWFRVAEASFDSFLSKQKL